MAAATGSQLPPGLPLWMILLVLPATDLLVAAVSAACCWSSLPAVLATRLLHISRYCGPHVLFSVPRGPILLLWFRLYHKSSSCGSLPSPVQHPALSAPLLQTSENSHMLSYVHGWVCQLFHHHSCRFLRFHHALPCLIFTDCHAKLDATQCPPECPLGELGEKSLLAIYVSKDHTEQRVLYDREG